MTLALLLLACGSAPQRADPPVELGPLGLELRFLAVGGWKLTHGEDALITAPLFTNPSLWDMSLGEIWPEREAVDAYLGDVSDARAVIIGHGHYDHLLDVPYVRSLTDDATVYGNLSTQRLLAGFAPDPDASCPVDSPAPETWALVPRDRVVAMNALDADVVDYRSCGGVETCTPASTDQAGAAVEVPGLSVRLRALCSKHAPQYGALHFGEGCVTEEPCGPVRRADEWREGTTLAWLIDFVDADGQIAVRVYYHDAPSDWPIGAPTAGQLAEHPVDVALLNAGNYEQVEDFPGRFLREVRPRFALFGHWENFFQTLDVEESLYPIPGMDLDELRVRLEEQMPGGEGKQWWIPLPGTEISL